MKFKTFLCLFVTVSLAVFSCKKDETEPTPEKELEIKVQPYFAGQKVYLDSVYTTSEGYKIQFIELRFYAANLKNGTKSLSDVAFFNYKATGTSFLKVKGDHMDFHTLTGVLGVDSARNHADPSAFAVSNPLNIQIANDMHWGWNPGYIFMYIDAKIDTIPDATLNMNHFLSYHIGKDENLQQLNFPVLNWVKQSDYLYRATMKLELDKFFTQPNPIDVHSENSSHTAPGQEVLSTKAITNFANALSFE